MGVPDPAPGRHPGLDSAHLGRGHPTRPEQFTVPTVLERFTALGDPHAGIDDAVGTLDRLIALAAELGPAEKPPRAATAQAAGSR